MTENEQDDTDGTRVGSAPPREDATAPGEFAAGYWEGRYASGEPTSRYDPGPSLVEQTSALPAGRALDAGCGRGADAVWLASRGWRVTAVDVSATALGLAQERARTAGAAVADRIEWVLADLTDWSPGARRYDLVTSSYVHVPGPAEELFGRLASWVAPGGTLLVVGHADGPGAAAGDHGHGGHEHPAGSRVRAEQVTGGLPEDQWEVVVAASTTSTVRRPDGAGHVTLNDTVVRARRHAASQP